MNRLAVGFGRGFPRAWLVPIAALTTLFGIAAAGVLSRAIAADFLAWWPVWVGLGLTAYLVRDKRLGALRMSGLVPLAALFFVGLFTWGHLAGWGLMPSSLELVGPEAASTSRASLTAGIDGRIVVSTGSEFLYRVMPIRRGGPIGIPNAAELVLDSTISVTLDPPGDPGIYSYAGWDMTLSPAPIWSLRLDGAIDADLSDLRLEQLSLTGSGTVRLGHSEAEVPVSVSAPFTVIVRAGTPVRVVGSAAVPSSWVLTDGGARTPGGGEGWSITVSGEGTLTVIEG